MKFFLTLCLLLLLSPVFKKCLEERGPDLFLPEKIATLAPEGSFGCYGMTGEALGLLEQPFTYLGHGEEAVAFLSEDKRFVLKFFLKESLRGKRRFSLPNIKDWLLGMREQKVKRRAKRRQESLFETLRRTLAVYEKMQEKTGLIALHFSPFDKDLPEVLLKKGSDTFLYPLKNSYFALQHKATLTWEKLKEGGDEKRLRQAMEDFFVARAKKGFTDKRGACTLATNFGFLGDTFIQFDLGGVVFSEEIAKNPAPEIERLQNFLQH